MGRSSRGLSNQPTPAAADGEQPVGEVVGLVAFAAFAEDRRDCVLLGLGLGVGELLEGLVDDAV